jgi:hypothetical protein
VHLFGYDEMANHDFLERAFALAESGGVSKIDEIRGTLLLEGYSHREVAQLSGPALSRQLRARMVAAGKPECIGLKQARQAGGKFQRSAGGVLAEDAPANGLHLRNPPEIFR